MTYTPLIDIETLLINVTQWKENEQNRERANSVCSCSQVGFTRGGFGEMRMGDGGGHYEQRRYGLMWTLLSLHYRMERYRRSFVPTGFTLKVFD